MRQGTSQNDSPLSYLKHFNVNEALRLGAKREKTDPMSDEEKMTTLETKIRPPTGTSWVTTVAAVIVSGEAYYESTKGARGTLFSFHLQSAELLTIGIVGGVVAFVALLYSLSLYFLPGALKIDPNTQKYFRTLRKPFKLHHFEGPLTELSLLIHFYSPPDQERGIFKRIEIEIPTEREILLFGDLPRGDEFILSAREYKEHFGCFEEIVRRP